MQYLEITDAHGRRRRVTLDRPRLLIGREPTCDVHLPHPNVSRRHAQLQKTDQGRWLLQDLSSLNHVFVENHPVKQVVLDPGKQVRIAEYRLCLRESAGDSDSGTTPPTTTEEATEAWTGLEPGWLEQLQVFQRALLRAEAPRHVLERLAGEFQRIVQPQVVAVGLAAPGPYHWEVFLSEEGVAPPCLREAEAFVQGEDSDVKTIDLKKADGAGPPTLPGVCLLFPIKGRSAVLGHVLVQRPRFNPLPSAIQRYLTLLTTHAGLVWDNFQLAELRLAQKEIEAELRQARQIQIDLFPPTFDVDQRLGAFAVNLPSVQVSGDYYDLFRTGPDTVAFVVADAMGHGMPAALMMAAVRASMRMGVVHRLPWPAVFNGLDEIIAQANTGAYVTGLLGEMDLRRGEVWLASAGHLPPSIVVNGEPVKVPGQSQTRPWGLPFEVPWEPARVSLAEGPWSILCFTDGITDAASRTSGARVVAEYHRRNHHLSAEDLCQGLLSEVAARTGGLPGDDQTVVALCSPRRAP
jgi:hypothetical protein